MKKQILLCERAREQSETILHIHEALHQCVLLENVDRLLKSPAKQRGRDFGIILACLNDLGYSAEWRVINAAEYGGAQRRRRTFIFAYRNDTNHAAINEQNPADIITKTGLMPQAFPIVDGVQISTITLPTDIVEVSDTFTFPFKSAGFMTGGTIYTSDVEPVIEQPILLGSILEKCNDEDFYLTVDELKDWAYMKGSKRINRTAANGHEYVFSEGPVGFPDSWDKPSRTMLTSESTKNRSTHVVADPGTGRLRILLPVEAERLQGFDDDWTNTGMPKRMRYFCMGNALVVPMITRMGKVLDTIIANEK